MQKILRLFLFVVVSVGFSFVAVAQDFRVGDLRVDRPWARATAGMARNGAAYLTVSNHGEVPDKLIAIATPVARMAAVHSVVMVDNVMKMQPVAGIEVHPGEPVVLRPGGLHVMLMGLTRPLKVGETFPLSVTFEKAGTIEVQVVVRKAGAMAPDHGHRDNKGS